MSMGILIGLILWFMLSFVIANAAGQRGRSAFAWFLFSLLTTPILAALFLLLFPPVGQQSPSLASNYPLQTDVPGIDEPARLGSPRASVAILAVTLVVLLGVGLLMLAKLINPVLVSNTSSSETSSSSQRFPYSKSDQVAVPLTCRYLLSTLDDSRYMSLIEPVIDFMGQHADLGTPVNRTSYLLTECRFREDQAISAAVNHLLEQKRLGQLPDIPIGGATSDAYVRKVWIPFDKWVRHKGPRPNFAAADR
jgi:hypothetical protein